jgi:hypothetical protein
MSLDKAPGNSRAMCFIESFYKTFDETKGFAERIMENSF